MRRQSVPAELFPQHTPYGDALRQHQKAPLLNPYTGPRRPRSRSPPRADLRPQAVREKSAENRNNPESYGQMREKAIQNRSKVIPPGPQHYYIGADQGVKRPRPAANQAALDRRTKPRTPAVKRRIDGAEDRRVKRRIGAADNPGIKTVDFTYDYKPKPVQRKQAAKAAPNKAAFNKAALDKAVFSKAAYRRSATRRSFCRQRAAAA